jgi:membrane-associated phospholipid phosphatase
MRAVFLVFLVLFTTCHVAQAQAWELRYLQRVEKTRSSNLTPLMRGLSRTSPPLCLATPPSMFVTGLLTKDKALRQSAITGGIGLGLTVLSTHAFKRLIKRPRPYERYPNDLHPLSVESSYSMPSGHTSTAFYTATWLTLEYPKWYVAVPMFLWAGTVSFSRNYLGVHYGSDVLIGMALGSAAAYGTWRARKLWQ